MLRYDEKDTMAALKKRLGASVVLTLFSLFSIMLLLPRSRVDQLQKITLGTTIDLGMDGIWKGWVGSSEVEDDRVEETGGGIRLVVFGDSWVDDSVENGGNGKGRSWVEVLCEEINCTSRLNFAASQPADAFPSLEPTGVTTSNIIHAEALQQDRSIPLSAEPVASLPDLATQIQSFIALPVPKVQPKQTLFVLSFGFWDIYDFARMDYNIAQNATHKSIDTIFKQLDVLYLHFIEKLYPAIAQAAKTNTTEAGGEEHPYPPFRVIIPRLFDPTLLPGWLSHRPMPASPSSIAEQQKNAVYLTERWNSLMENRMGGWVNSPPPTSVSDTVPPPSKYEIGVSRTDVRHPEPSIAEKVGLGEEIHVTRDAEAEAEADPSLGGINKGDKAETPDRDIFYYDTPTYLLQVIVEHNLEREGVSDANGLGKGTSPYDSVYAPCVRAADEYEGRTEGDEFVEADGMLVCRDPEDFLFWDAWGLGSVAKAEIGREIGTMVLEGKSLRSAW